MLTTILRRSTDHRIFIEVEGMGPELDLFTGHFNKLVDSMNSSHDELFDKVEFERFFQMYGRKEKRIPALLKWKKLKKADKEKIFETLPAFIKSTPDIKFRPMAVTYLNQRRWEDELEVKKSEPLPEWAKPNDYEP